MSSLVWHLSILLKNSVWQFGQQFSGSLQTMIIINNIYFFSKRNTFAHLCPVFGQRQDIFAPPAYWTYRADMEEKISKIWLTEERYKYIWSNTFSMLAGNVLMFFCFVLFLRNNEALWSTSACKLQKPGSRQKSVFVVMWVIYNVIVDSLCDRKIIQPT